MKVHLLDRGFGGAVCGVGHRGEPSTVTDPSEVTCESCLNAIERDLEPLEDRAAREGRTKARQRARARAVKTLQERHEVEFEELRVLYESEELEASVAEAKAHIELRARWDEEYRDRRRAELERELERLG